MCVYLLFFLSILNFNRRNAGVLRGSQNTQRWQAFSKKKASLHATVEKYNLDDHNHSSSFQQQQRTWLTCVCTFLCLSILNFNRSVQRGSQNTQSWHQQKKEASLLATVEKCNLDEQNPSSLFQQQQRTWLTLLRHLGRPWLVLLCCCGGGSPSHS